MDALSARGLSVGYRVRRGRWATVLPDLDLTLRAGELVCLLGANGAGKSTLLRTLAGVQKPVSGEVRLGGRALDAVAAHERAKELAVVLTGRPAVAALRGRDLVELGRAPYTGWAGTLRAHDRAAVEDALAITGSTDVAGRSLHELSDGETQRLMLARALAQEPSVLLLDEPTAFLDAPRRAELTAMLRTLCARMGIAALLSTHDVELALRNADRIWLVQPTGEVVVAAPEDLVLSGALHEAFTGDGFTFDPLAGGFRVAVAGDGVVALTGAADEVTTEWTARALRRCGLHVDAESSHAAALHVRIDGSGGATSWHVHDGHDTTEHTSLESVTEHLRAGSHT